MPCVGANRCIPPFESPWSRSVSESLVLNRAYVSAAPSHHETAIPFLRQQQLELDLFFYDSCYFAVWSAGIHVFGRCDERIFGRE